MYVGRLPRGHRGKKEIGRGSLALIAVPVSVLLIGGMLLTMMLMARAGGYTQFDVFLHTTAFETIVWSFSIPTALILIAGIWLGKRHSHEHKFAASAQYISMSILALLGWAVLFGMYVVLPMAFEGATWHLAPLPDAPI